MDAVVEQTQWRHFVNHAQKSTWSVKVESHPNLDVKEHIEEITMDQQAELRLRGYSMRTYT